MKTWNNIFNEFKESTGIDPNKIADYRPLRDSYVLRVDMPCIIVWLKDGSTIIYISKETEL